MPWRCRFRGASPLLLGSFAACAAVLVSNTSSAAAGAPTSSSEATEPRTWNERHWGLELQLGLGTPTGLVGALIDATPVPWWTLSAGVGQGFSGPQFALGTRFRFPRHATPYLGFGFSAGRFCVPGNGEDLWGGG